MRKLPPKLPAKNKAGTSPARLAALRKLPYPVYLQSKEWQKTRLRAIARAEGRCQICNVERPLTVHHNTYERIGCEKNRDLIVLCWDCHKLFHRHRKLAP